MPFAVIGAAAMAVHGVSRATRDLDLLTVADRCLLPAFWDELGRAGVRADVRPGGTDDPLAGVVRLRASDEHPLDLIVGRTGWQAEIPARARETLVEGVLVPVATRVDLILLKLYAGGPQDAWDIEQLLACGERAALVAEVEAALDQLPAECRRLWERITEAPEPDR